MELHSYGLILACILKQQDVEFCDGFMLLEFYFCERVREPTGFTKRGRFLSYLMAYV